MLFLLPLLFVMYDQSNLLIKIQSLYSSHPLLRLLQVWFIVSVNAYQEHHQKNPSSQVDGLLQQKLIRCQIIKNGQKELLSFDPMRVTLGVLYLMCLKSLLRAKTQVQKPLQVLKSYRCLDCSLGFLIFTFFLRLSFIKNHG